MCSLCVQVALRLPVLRAAMLCLGFHFQICRQYIWPESLQSLPQFRARCWRNMRFPSWRRCASDTIDKASMYELIETVTLIGVGNCLETDIMIFSLRNNIASFCYNLDDQKFYILALPIIQFGCEALDEKTYFSTIYYYY